MHSLDSSCCRSCSDRAGCWLSPRWRLSGCTLRCKRFRRLDCGPARPRLPRMSWSQPHLCDGRLPRSAGVPAPRDSAFRFPARLYLSAHDRIVSSRRVRLAYRHPATSATPSAVLDRRRLYRPWCGIDPCPCRPPDRRRPDRRPGRASRHHRAGTGLWRRHHRHRQYRWRKEAAWLGCAGRAHGVHQLPRAIRHSRLDLLRLRPRPVRQARRHQRAGDRSRRLLRADSFQRVVARPLSLRPGRMAMAYADVRRGAADEFESGRRRSATLRSCTHRATGRGWCLPAP